MSQKRQLMAQKSYFKRFRLKRVKIAHVILGWKIKSWINFCGTYNVFHYLSSTLLITYILQAIIFFRYICYIILNLSNREYIERFIMGFYISLTNSSASTSCLWGCLKENWLNESEFYCCLFPFFELHVHSFRILNESDPILIVIVTFMRRYG